MASTRWPVTNSTPSDRASASSAAAIAPLPPRATGHPTACASSPSTRPNEPLSGCPRRSIEWAAIPANSARAAGSRKASRARDVAGSSAGSPNRARRSGCRGGRMIGARIAGTSRSHSRTYGPNSRRQASASRPSASSTAARSRSSTTLRPGASAWATGASGCTHSSPWRARSSDRRNGDARLSGWTDAQTSWTNPGSVSSADRVPPPTVVGGLVHAHGPAGAREVDRGGEPVRARPDDDGIERRARSRARRPRGAASVSSPPAAAGPSARAPSPWRRPCARPASA